MQPHTVVSREEWIAARKAHLAHEKEYTKARERLAEERRALPWVKVDKDYSTGLMERHRSVICSRDAASSWCSM